MNWGAALLKNLFLEKGILSDLVLRDEKEFSTKIGLEPFPFFFSRKNWASIFFPFSAKIKINYSNKKVECAKCVWLL